MFSKSLFTRNVVTILCGAAMVAGCQNSSTGAGGAAAAIETVAPSPGTSAPPADKVDVYRFGDGHQAFVRSDGAAILMPPVISAEIFLETVNANIGWLAQNEGSTWREKCSSYRQSYESAIREYRDALASGDGTASELKRDLESLLSTGALGIGPMKLKYRFESAAEIGLFVDSQWPSTLSKPSEIRSPVDWHLRLDAARSSAGRDSLVVLSGKFNEFGSIVTGMTIASANEYCDILLGTTKFHVSYFNFGDSVPVKIEESPEGVRPAK